MRDGHIEFGIRSGIKCTWDFILGSLIPGQECAQVLVYLTIK